MSTFKQALALHRESDQPFILFEDVSFTYREIINQAIALLCGLRKLGALEGERVALMLPNSPEFVIGYYALMLGGFRVVPLNVNSEPGQISSQLNRAKACAAIFHSDYVNRISRSLDQVESLRLSIIVGQPESGRSDVPFQDLIELGCRSGELWQDLSETPDSEAELYFSRGIFGESKGVRLSQRNLLSNAESFAEAFHIASGDMIVGVLPLYHLYGQTCVLNSAMIKGGSVLLFPGFRSDAILQQVASKRPHYFAGLPSMFRLLLNDPLCTTETWSSVRYILCGGMPLSKKLRDEFEEATSALILEGYGLSEASPVVSSCSPYGLRKPGSVGLPIPGVVMKLADETGREVGIQQNGEIWVKGDNIALGYLDSAKDGVFDNGWLKTGDYAFRDEDGYIFVLGNKSRRIIKGGFEIYLTEIEQALLDHPGVAKAALCGIPDEEMGMEPAAVVVPDPSRKLTTEDLENFCVERLPSYQQPRQFLIRKELPFAPSGAIDYDAISRLFA